MTDAINLCASCHTNPPKYTCPRCATRTCSAECSAKHKMAGAGCSGVRDRAAYVPMNSYGWGTMMDDYAFLEDVGRTVEEHGRDIGRGGYTRGSAGRGRGGRPGASSKRDTLQMQLALKEIDMDLLPEGMARRKSNESRYDAKAGSIFLTIEFVIHGQSMLVHRNNIITPLVALLKHAADRSTIQFPDNLTSDPDTFFLLAQYPPEPPNNPYHPLDAQQTLESVLRGKAFLEYPSIEIVKRASFKGRLVGESGWQPPPAKRRKVMPAPTALPDYASSSDEGEEEGEGDGGGGELGLLGGYESGASASPMVESSEGAADSDEE